MQLPGYGCEIRGTGTALGSVAVQSSDLEEKFGLRNGWVEDRTGVQVRYLVGPGERTTDLAVRASEAALESAGLAANQLDLVICATMTAEMPCPATAHRVVDRLGAVPCGAFDLTSACTGFLSGMHMAANGIRAGAYNHVLVVGADVLSPTVDPNDPRMMPLFGDAAGAAIISRSKDAKLGCLAQRLRSDGSQWSALYQPQREEDIPPGMKPPERYGYLCMNGLAVFRFAVEALTQIIPETLADAGLSIGEADLVLLHQSNLRIIEPIRATLGLSEETCPAIIQNTGNTSGGSVGLLLDEVNRQGLLHPDMTVVLAAVGGGLSWGASVWKI